MASAPYRHVDGAGARGARRAAVEVWHEAAPARAAVGSAVHDVVRAPSASPFTHPRRDGTQPSSEPQGPRAETTASREGRSCGTPPLPNSWSPPRAWCGTPRPWSTPAKVGERTLSVFLGSRGRRAMGVRLPRLRHRFARLHASPQARRCMADARVKGPRASVQFATSPGAEGRSSTR